MNIEKLSKRLENVVKYIPKGSILADIGSDHAYLPCYAVHSGIVSSAIAGEVVEGPYQSALKQVEQNGYTSQISVRMGDGLEVISKGEVDCITIAGMGGTLIASILEKGKDKLRAVKRLILQPNISAISIRTWLMENGWRLIAEEILEEDGKIYEILVAEQGDPEASYNSNHVKQQMLLGPFLMNEKSNVFQKKWKIELANWKKIISQLEKAADSEENLEKKQELKSKIQMVEEVLGE